MANKQKMVEQIKETLEDVKPWQRVETSIRGVFLIKAPSRQHNENIMIEINPLDEFDRPIKRRGIFLSNTKQLECFKEAMSGEKVMTLLGALDEINPGNKNNLGNGKKLEI